MLLMGFGLLTVPAAVLLTACGGQLHASRSELDFGYILVDGAKTIELTVTYSGGFPATGSAVKQTIEGDRDFAISSTDCHRQLMPRDQGCSVMVSFRPRSATSKTAILVLKGEVGTGTANIDLRGIGSNPRLGFTPTQVNFGNQTQNTAVYSPIDLTNLGQAPLPLGQISVDIPVWVKIIVDECSGHTLNPMKSCVVGAVYPASPLTPSGTVSGNLIVPFGIYSDHQVKVPLRGCLNERGSPSHCA